MNPKNPNPWLTLERMDELLAIEPLMIILGLALSSWLIYKMFLRSAPDSRHESLRRLFKNLAFHIGILASLYTLYLVLRAFSDEIPSLGRIDVYLGILTLISGGAVFIKSARILMFEYLFLGHMQEGVPVLIVNLTTLLLSMLVGGWFLTEIFGLKLGPLLATSAVFSVVIGLAVQDTLGNLFAGVALQFDKPYEIGDWIELFNGSQKIIGQVQEISWRATILYGILDEVMIIPNRVMAQTHISNFAGKTKSMARTHTFRVPYGTPINEAKAVLLEAAFSEAQILHDPAPLVLVSDANENFIHLRLVYNISDYIRQFTIADHVNTKVIEGLQKVGIPLAAQRIEVINRLNT